MNNVTVSWMQKLRHYWVIPPLLLVMLLLAIPELENMGYSLWPSNPCNLQEIDQGGYSTRLYAPITRWALRFSPTPTVAIIYIDPRTEPSEILTNTCAARVFLSRLVEDLNSLHANVIVIDKYYSDTACTEPIPNQTFLDAMNKSVLPVVVGRPTHKLENNAKAGGCLALSNPVKFDDKANVHYGLTRLNSDTLKLPLRWPVFQENANPELPPTPLPEEGGAGDSLALVAATQQDPNIQNEASVKKLLAMHLHPYTTFLDLPHVNAMTVLCSAEPAPHDAYGKPFGDLCKGMVQPLDSLDNNKLKLSGKIVVIGDKSEEDMQPFPGGEDKPGIWLQANYIQSLLDHRFLREIPLGLTIICLILFIFVVYWLYWFLQPERALVVGLISVAALLVVSLGVLVSTSYFTPLWALWGGVILVIFRYLETRAHHLIAQLKQQHTDPAE
jgi:hypothetical protein